MADSGEAARRTLSRSSDSFEERLRESEARFRTLAENIPDVLCRFDRNLRRLYMNPVIESITGLPVSHYLGKTNPELGLPPQLCALWDSKILAVFKSGEAQVLEFSLPDIDGEVRHYEMRLVPESSVPGKVETVLGVARDITTRKCAEDRLSESEERFRTLVEVSAQKVWMTNTQGDPQIALRFSRASRGGNREQSGPWDWLGAVHPDDRERVRDAWTGAMKTAAAYVMEYREIDTRGEWRQTLSQAAPIFQADGTVREWVGMNTDVTDRKRTEQELARAIQHVNAHMDNSPLAVIEFDAQLIVTRWSNEAEKVFGWTAAETLGRRMFEIPWVHESDLEAVRRVAQGMLDRTRPRNVSLNRNQRKDGAVIECEWYNSAIYDDQGDLASVLSLVLDVTNRKRAEDRLRHTQKMESVGLLAAGVAHDFNNLLVGVIGNAGLAQAMLAQSHPASELLEEIVRTGERAADLTRQMLAYAGKGQFLISSLDLSALVLELRPLVQPSIPSRTELRFEMQPSLTIKGDRGQVQQVFTNFVLNAAEAIGSEAGAITVRTGALDQCEASIGCDLDDADLRPGRYVYLEVSDTGCGMDCTTRARAFDPFFTTKFTGRGLGLAAVAGIMRSHGGAVHVTSAPGRGSRFRALFPAAEGPELTVSRAVPRRVDYRGTETILVVDDEETVRMFVKKTLESHGYSVIAARSGLEAIEALNNSPEKISVVILDLGMPGMSGHEALPRLLDIQPKLRVIITSGYAEREAMSHFDGQPVTEYLQKPYTVDHLAEKLKRVIN